MHPESLPISETRFAAIDFESAGAAPGRTETPVQIGIAILENGQISSLFRSYLHTDEPIVWSAKKVHGISEEDLVGAPTLLSLWPEIRERLGGSYVIAHSAGTERRFLRAFPGHGFGPWVDTLPMTRALYPTLETYDLSSLAMQFGLEEKIRALCPDGRWHDALFDAVASLFLFQHLVQAADLASQPAELLSSPKLEAYYRNRLTRKSPGPL